MTSCLFVSDLHGRLERYRSLFAAIARKRPDIVFLGGDLLPSGIAALSTSPLSVSDFINSFLVPQFSTLRDTLGRRYPDIFVILGNDDARYEEEYLLDAESDGLWRYAHNRKIACRSFDIYGYSYVPPTPFMLKDWERYDVSAYVDPGCVPPDQGFRTVPVSDYDIRYSTIAADLDSLTEGANLRNSIILFHSPPHNTKLDFAALEGKFVDHVPLDPHIGSIAIRRFIEARQPYLTLHGHVHEAARLTGVWHERIGETHLFNAAHDGNELAIVEFHLESPEKAIRELI
jgi:Icc-related predicted phosphoesterase